MGVPCLLLILWTLPGGIHSKTNTSSCINQLGSIRVEVGGNVTIPCIFSYPKSHDDTTKIRVYWHEGGNNSCRYSTSIYNHNSNWTHDRYTGRILMVGNPEEENTASIRIQGVYRNDGPVLCCVVEVISDEEGSEKNEVIIKDHNGTVLLFPDQSWVFQLDAVPALIGEDVTIPCFLYYSSERRNSSNFVTWRKGRSATCPENERIHTWTAVNTLSQNKRFSLVNYPDDISLIIKGVNTADTDYYCCEVAISRRSKEVSVHGTELVVEGGTSYSYKVFQSNESSAHLGDSAMINCSFNSSKGRIPLWSEIYWRVGSPMGNYSYHPSKEMIHSSYRNRTSLSGQANLHILNVQRGDVGHYCCFVILRFCNGQDKLKSILIHGSGTKLNVEVSESPSPPETITITIISSFGALFLVIILCGILFLLKKKGAICKKVKRMDEKGPEKCDAPPSVQPSSLNANSVYETVPEMETREVDASGVLYSQLNVDSLNKGRTMSKTKSHPVEDPNILYSDVRTPQ